MDKNYGVLRHHIMKHNAKRAKKDDDTINFESQENQEKIDWIAEMQSL